MQLTPHQVREVAVKTHRDPKTVRSFLEGRPVRSTTRAQLESALREFRNQLPRDPGAEGGAR
jgi:hypothetical protein